MNKTHTTLHTAAAQLLMIAALTLGVLVAGLLAGNSVPRFFGAVAVFGLFFANVLRGSAGARNLLAILYGVNAVVCFFAAFKLRASIPVAGLQLILGIALFGCGIVVAASRAIGRLTPESRDEAASQVSEQPGGPRGDQDRLTGKGT